MEHRWRSIAALGWLIAACGGDPDPRVELEVAEGSIPCDVAQALASHCQTCHGAEPIAGAPMPLVDYADFHARALTRPDLKVYQLARQRLRDEQRPMPPFSPLSDSDRSVLEAWLGEGAGPDVEEDAACEITRPSADLSTGPLIPGPGEVCYEFKTHASTTRVDDVPYDVGEDGEHYEQFYFDVPWPEDSIATSYATRVDNPKVLHHWLLFATDEEQAHGFHKRVTVPTLAGTNPVLLAGWALGGPNVVYPKDVGAELPAPGKQLNLQWHFYNTTGMPQSDASSVQVCTVPRSSRPKIVSVAWLGSEDLNGAVLLGGEGMPPHQESTFTTTCVPGRRGLADDEPIQIIGFEPHMHRLGTRMKTEVHKLDGTVETIFDRPFSFGNETHYFRDYTLQPGETLTTSCTFNNTTDRGVAFGESTDDEMCYQFVFHWPARSLSNGKPSLLGVRETCW